jgi:acetaldehyde dehydrogenase (acetylating)
MSIHSKNEEVILEFGLKKPAFRICVNTPTAHGSIGLTTGLDPAMTLGCGGWGGNITSDNISPRHLLNIKRLAYEVRPATRSTAEVASGKSDRPLPAAPARPQIAGIPAETLSSRIDAFLSSRGFRPAQERAEVAATGAKENVSVADSPEAFICEDDVRAAMQAGRQLLVGERTIVTPSARELGESARVFIDAGWPH